MVLSIGIIGSGHIAKLAHLPNYQKIEGVDIIAVADINDRPAKSLAKKYKCKAYTNYQEMIDKHQLDAISVCTPPSARTEIIKYAAENNINILCEKPMANSLGEAIKIKSIVEKFGIQFMMGFSLRFSKWYQTAFDHIHNYRLGDILFSNCVYASQIPSYPWLHSKEKSGGGVIIDRGSHIIDAMCWFFGLPSSVFATTFNKRVMNVEENAFLIFNHNGMKSQLTFSFGVNKSLDRMDICGTACNIIIDHELNGFFFLPASNYILKDHLIELPKNALKMFLNSKGFSRDNMYFNEIHYFIDCLKNGSDVSPNHIDGLNNLKIIDSCYNSIRENAVCGVL